MALCSIFAFVAVYSKRLPLDSDQPGAQDNSKPLRRCGDVFREESGIRELHKRSGVFRRLRYLGSGRQFYLLDRVLVGCAGPR